MDFNKILPQCLEIARESGQIIATNWREPSKTMHKGPVDLVTNTDLAVQAFLREKLTVLLPEAAFLGEEGQGNIDPYNGLVWIVDPVDGTTNFVHRIPMMGTSIALCMDGEPQLGIVNAPMLAQCFYACKGSGAFCNQTEIRVSNAKVLTDALVCTGFPYDMGLHLDAIIKRLQKVLPATQGLRRLGAASLDLAYVAQGKLDAFYETGLKPWDLAAGILLVTEAGGSISNFQGQPYQFGDSILADNTLIHAAMLDLLQNAA